MRQSIEDQYRELIQEYNKLPNAGYYGIKGDEAIRLTHEAKRNSFATIGYCWLVGFITGIRYCKNQQKQKKKQK